MVAIQVPSKETTHSLQLRLTCKVRGMLLRGAEGVPSERSVARSHTAMQRDAEASGWLAAKTASMGQRRWSACRRSSSTGASALEAACRSSNRSVDASPAWQAKVRAPSGQYAHIPILPMPGNLIMLTRLISHLDHSHTVCRRSN